MRDPVKSTAVAILCHPASDNVCAAVVENFSRREKPPGHAANLQDLYRIQFDPRRQPGKQPSFQSTGVAHESNLLAGASVIVFAYPIWFGSPPAILNGYVEIELDATVPEAMVTIDEGGIITGFSPAAETALGYTPAEMVGRHVRLLIGSPSPAAHEHYLARYRTTGAGRIIGIGRRVIARHKDGSAVSLELAIDEAIGSGQRQFHASLRDLSPQEAAEEQRQGMQNDLLHFTRVGAMDAIASTLAHELNQPLTAVANYVQASRSLLETAREPGIASVREALAIAEQQVLRAGEIVHRLRAAVARGEARKNIEPVAPVIADSCRLGMAGAQAWGIFSRIDLATDLGQVFIDPIQIQQVLINLIRNAVEAMVPNGRGEVRITSRNDDAFVRIIVADQGPGLPQHVSERLFQAFVSTKAGGMGLGLSICRTIVEAHGGRIWYETAPGGGASFQFTVPRAGIEARHG